MTVVSIARCASYDPERLTGALASATASIGSLGSAVKPGCRCLLKINHLGNYPPEAAVNTHPAFLRAVIELVRPITSNIVVADGLWDRGLDGFAKSGTLQACRDAGVELVNLHGRGYREVHGEGMETVDSFPFSEDALDADVVVSLPKLKTHMLCLMTGAVKNNYGFLPRRLKVNYHMMFADPDDFSNMLVDVWSARPPEIVLMDAVVAMEGSGPSSGGRPVDLGLVLAGRDSVAVDAVASALMGIDPADVPSTRHAARRALGEADLAKIEVAGESIASARRTFELPASRSVVDVVSRRLPASARRLLARVVRGRRLLPRVLSGRCVGCGLCARHCPADAIELSNAKARIRRDRCIACFCCQEFCEKDAVGVRRSGLGHLIGIMESLRRRLRGKRRR
jgi:uncharacterized protein (DUF362 family)/Pyruvate/2-oxoacid:ferredoxin oxidoreductase delta subunit